MKNNKCKICKSKSEYLEKHHIIPKSRGGTDDENNLILICSKCHGLAHNVDFSNERGGLIKESIIKSEKELKQSNIWLEKNEHIYFKLMEDLLQKDETKHSLILNLLELNKINSLHIKNWYETGQLKLKFTITI
jgi:hypothetical protein